MKSREDIQEYFDEVIRMHLKLAKIATDNYISHAKIADMETAIIWIEIAHTHEAKLRAIEAAQYFIFGEETT